MYPYICQIYGPLYLNNYGLAIFIGILVFIKLTNKNPRRPKLLSTDKFINIVVYGTIVGVIGGRTLDLLNNYKNYTLYEALAFWEPGYSVLGAIISIIIFLCWYLKKENIPVLPFLDLVAIYAPLLQSISRIGCFFAGCCFGAKTNMPWAITYTHPDVATYSNFKFVPIHPTQLYSSALLFLIFLIMLQLEKKVKKPGLLITSYLMLSSIERFVVDFYRADREFYSYKLLENLSIHQWISMLIFTLAFVGFLCSYKHKKQYSNFS